MNNFNCPACGIAIKTEIDRTKYVIREVDSTKTYSVFPCRILTNERNDGEKHWIEIDGISRGWVYRSDVFDSLDIAMNVLKSLADKQQKEFLAAKLRYAWENPISRMSV